VFFVNVAVGVLGVALAPFVLEESRDPSAPKRLDFLGALAVTAGLLLLVYGLTRAEAAGFWSVGARVSLGFALVLLAAFVVVEGRVRDPLVPLGVLRSRRLVGANLVALVLTAVTTPPMFLCTLYAQEVLGLPPERAGLLFPPFNLAAIAGSLLGPRVVAAVGERASMASGLMGISLGVLVLVGVSAEGGVGLLFPAFVLMGSGLGLASVASTAAGTSAAGERQGLGSGLLNSAAQIGTALGLAVLVPLAAARADALGGGDPSAAVLVEGYRWAFVGAAVIAALGALLVPLLLRGKGNRR
jgi:MFS family permease